MITLTAVVVVEARTRLLLHRTTIYDYWKKKKKKKKKKCDNGNGNGNNSDN